MSANRVAEKIFPESNYLARMRRDRAAALIAAEYAPLVNAAKNLREVKGRFHTEIAYKLLLEALAHIEGDATS